MRRQCTLLEGVSHAVIFIGPPEKWEMADASLSWPPDRQNPSVLIPVAKASYRSRKSVVKAKSSTVPETGEPLDAIASPLFSGPKLFAVAAIEISHGSKAVQRAAVQQVQIGAKWLEILIRLQGSTTNEQLKTLVTLVAITLNHEQFQVAAAEVVNEISRRFSCRRVSLGFLQSNRVRIEAVANASSIDPKSNLIGDIQNAMDEAVDQSAALLYPPKGNSPEEDKGPLITRFHARLSQSLQGSALLTLPLMKNREPVGALLLERSPDTPFSQETQMQCGQIAQLLGPVLENRKQEDRPFFLKFSGSIRKACAGLFPPRRLSAKIALILAAVLMIGLSQTKTMLRITCDSSLEAEVSQVVVAPQQGFIAQANARAGDRVVKGDLLATMDDQALLLEKRKWESQLTQYKKEYRQALSGLDRAQAAILNAKRAQADAQLRLIEQQLARIRLVAPLSGLVVKGDLSQSIGAPVTRGQTLFEVALTDKYRVVLNAQDSDIGLIAPGQQGRLKLSGMPEKSIPITIERLTPVSAIENGKNFFRVEARMAYHSDLMRPGMKGIAKIETSREKIIWIMTRPLMSWLRLFTWQRLPWI